MLKVRLADSSETDFIEIDVAPGITFKQLVELIRVELDVDGKAVVLKLRKLPNTIVRNDRDVSRLRDFNELELVLRNSSNNSQSGAVSSQSAPYQATVTPRHIDVVY